MEADSFQQRFKKLISELETIDDEYQNEIQKEKQLLIEAICKKYKLSIKEVKAEFLNKPLKKGKKSKSKKLDLIGSDEYELDNDGFVVEAVPKVKTFQKKKINNQYYFLDLQQNTILDKSTNIVGKIDNGEYIFLT